MQALLGFSGSLASLGKSLMDMLAGIGKQGDIAVSGNSDSNKTKVGTILFVCEYLMGAVSITPIVLSVDAKSAQGLWQAGPCFKAQKSSNTIRINKTVYMFVPPVFVKQAISLNEAMADPEFNNLVESLSASISSAP